MPINVTMQLLFLNVYIIMPRINILVYVLLLGKVQNYITLLLLF